MAAELVLAATELARKMVREWGMSSRIGPMAWGSQGAVFLGEDVSMCMHAAKVGHPTFIDHDISKEVRHIGVLEYVLEHAEINDGN